MKQNKLTKLIFGIFLVIGILLLAGGVFALVHEIQFLKNADRVDAVITDIQRYRDIDGETGHDVYVSYEYAGKQYEIELNEYSSSMYVGQDIELLVDPKEPYKAHVGELIFLMGIILMIIGVVFALVGGIPFIIISGKTRKNKKLKENGRRIQATVDEIIVNYNIHVNYQHPYQIICSYKDEYSGVTYRFKSPNLWTDPSLVFEPGSYIDVWVNPDDYSKHYVDAEAQMENRIVDYT